MAPTNFIAVQCCQCSTMQVKQQKKSSNKWTCVVCNQKQSVRRSFAQGFMAKDVRKFVQSFNMARQFADAENLDPLPGESLLAENNQSLENELCRKQKRSSWSEYLDPEDTDPAEDAQGTSASVSSECDGDIRIVTELPKEMFKKPKLKAEHSSQLGSPEHAKLYKPSFAKRHATTHSSPNLQLQPRKPQLSNHITEDKITVPSDARATKAPVSSRWSNYITEDDDDSLHSANGRNFSKEESGLSSYAAVTSITTDQKVEDDIHPDFL